MKRIIFALAVTSCLLTSDFANAQSVVTKRTTRKAENTPTGKRDAPTVAARTTTVEPVRQSKSETKAHIRRSKAKY